MTLKKLLLTFNVLIIYSFSIIDLKADLLNPNNSIKPKEVVAIQLNGLMNNDIEFEESFIKCVLEFISEKNLRVVPTSPKIEGFVRRNKSYKSLLPVGIKL